MVHKYIMIEGMDMTTTSDKKIEYWKNQLLDLGKRNRMIKYRETTRATLKIIEPKFEDLFKELVINEKELIFQYPVDRNSDIRTYSVLKLLDELSCPIPVFLGEIKTLLDINERQKTLRNLRAKSKLALEEQGTNILYLSFGFIQWKEKDINNSEWIKSPLILVPVSLILDSLNAPYKLIRHDDEIVVNPTLSHLFEAEYGITLPNIDNDNPRLEDFMQQIEEIASEKGWKIIMETSIGLLSFLKINMYRDLENNLEKIKQNTVIKAMLGDMKDIIYITEKMGNYNHDEIAPKDCFQVVSADSSQQDAILLSKKGVSFVMQGPPGTGKSQTITNIIAEALSDGKKVLFVSEKMAALQVVYNKLTESGISEFCLALHSHKANKKEILNDLQDTLLQKKTKVKDEAIEQLDKLKIERHLLNEYAEELHKIISPLQISCYQAFGFLDELKEASEVAFKFDGIDTISREDFNEILYNLNRYNEIINKQDFDYKNNPWKDIAINSVSYDLRQNLDNRTNFLMNNLTSIISESNNLKDYNIDIPNSVGEIEVFIDEMLKLIDLPLIPRELFLQTDIERLLEETKKTRDDFQHILSGKKNAENYFTSDIWDIDIQIMVDNITEDIEKLKLHNNIKSKTREYILNSIEDFYNNLYEINESAQTIKKAFEHGLDLLGLSRLSALSSIDTVYNILLEINKIPFIMPQWLDVTIIKDALSHVDIYKELTNKINYIKNELLQDWESYIFSIDYRKILNRYKTDYNNIFKLFKKSYYRDKKEVLVLNRNPLIKIKDKDIIELLIKLQDLNDRLDELEKNHATIDKFYGISYTGISTDWDNISLVLSYIQKIIIISPELANSDKFKNLLMNDFDIRTSIINSIIEEIEPGIIEDFIKGFQDIYENVNCLSLNFDNICSKLKTSLQESDKIIKNKNLLVNMLISESIDFDCFERLQIAAIIQKKEMKLVSKSGYFTKIYGDFFKQKNTEWDYIIDIFVTLKDILNFVKKYNLPNEFYIKYSLDSVYRTKLNKKVFNISNVFNEIEDDFEWYNSIFESDLKLLDLAALLNKCISCYGNIYLLEMWLDYKENKNNCLSVGLNDYIYKIEKDMVNDIVNSFKKGFYMLWIDAAIEQNSTISAFKGSVQDKRVSDFCNLDEHQLKIARTRIRETLTHSLPDTDRFLHAKDEMSILQKELGKKSRIMPIRKLFKTIPNLLLKLKPCFMMSPLSVSYFLEADTYKFDIVIFDEASQIFPEDAIGAIFRSKQVIVVGDSKQLPPTNFFTSNANNLDGQFDNDSEDELEDEIYDSILEEAANVLPNKTLLWHYRSKHEHLIAFSNQEIYKNRLITFPSSKDKYEDIGVEYHKVLNGVYEDRCNINEAKRCIELVKEHIDKHPHRSLGIIAFSEKQQSTIELELYNFREQNQNYEWFFDDNKEEAFFIKNLENVQGDERDTIIFSICYAKNKNGKMLMNFGPLGKQGGERRLNVAVTRAKYNIKLVGSIEPSDIDLSRAKTEGARMLRSYIEFAINGAEKLTKSKKQSFDDEQDKLCDNICEFLISKGYAAKRSIGCSDYKIDIAVEHPNYKGIYIAGIECDGNSYIKTRTARERDHLRTRVLRDMGWNMYRIWSTEWVKQPVEEERKLIAFLDNCIKEFGSVVPVKKEYPDYEVPIETVSTHENNTLTKEKNNNPYGFEYYKIGIWWEAPQSLETSNENRIAEVLYYIIKIEQPIHMDLLYRRAAGLFGREKATSPVKSSVDYIMTNYMSSDVCVENGFVRMKDMDNVRVRVSETITEISRPIEYISLLEISKAMLVIASSAFGISEKEIITETARIFGFERTGPKIITAMNKAISQLLQSNKIRIVDEKIQVLEEI